MARKSKLHFCGFNCYGKWQQIYRIGKGRQRIQVVCDNCKKPIEKQPSTIKTTNFCNRVCFHAWQLKTGFMSGENNPSWLGGHTQYRGKNWQTQRKKALQRDNYSCQLCNTSTKLVHHMKPYQLFDDYKQANHLDNLISLCQGCHGKEEIEFNRHNQHLVGNRKIPHLISECKNCEKCTKIFMPSTAKGKWCNQCRTVQCQQCTKEFINQRYRNVKYCSRQCRNCYLDSHSKWSRQCAICKTRIATGRNFCKRCFLKHLKPSSHLYQARYQEAINNK